MPGIAEVVKNIYKKVENPRKKQIFVAFKRFCVFLCVGILLIGGGGRYFFVRHLKVASVFTTAFYFAPGVYKIRIQALTFSWECISRKNSVPPASINLFMFCVCVDRAIFLLCTCPVSASSIVFPYKNKRLKIFGTLSQL